MAEPQIEIRTAPLEPEHPELGLFIGWYCEWNGLEYGDVIARLGPDDGTGMAVVLASADALAAGKATMKEVIDAQP